MEIKITGVMTYYYKVCARKLWYFHHQIELESANEHVQLGKAIDENSYSRDNKHININDEINIDFIRRNKVIHEVKKSKKQEQASIFQIKYYLYYLNKHGVEDVKATLDYPTLRESVKVILEDEDIKIIDQALEEIKEICNSDFPQAISKKSICKECAYHDLCFI